MHGTVTQCYGTSTFPYYTPLAATAADTAAGNLSAQPEYYGLAAVHAVGTGNFLRVNNPASATVRAYAVQHADNSVTVVLDNVAPGDQRRDHRPAEPAADLRVRVPVRPVGRQPDHPDRHHARRPGGAVRDLHHRQLLLLAASYIGQNITLKFTGTEDVSLQTSFVIDDTALNVN